MIRDALATIMEDEAFAANVASGAVEIPIDGDGSPLAVNIVVKRGGTGTTALTGTFLATMYVDDTDGATTTVQTNLVPCTDAGHDMFHAVVYVPTYASGDFIGLDVNDASLVGGGSANVVDAWVFAL